MSKIVFVTREKCELLFTNTKTVEGWQWGEIVKVEKDGHEFYRIDSNQWDLNLSKNRHLTQDGNKSMLEDWVRFLRGNSDDELILFVHDKVVQYRDLSLCKFEEINQKEVSVYLFQHFFGDLIFEFLCFYQQGNPYEAIKFILENFPRFDTWIITQDDELVEDMNGQQRPQADALAAFWAELDRMGVRKPKFDEEC